MKVLIANRGEIAVRVVRACREAGIATVAVYSDADRDAPYVALADVAVRLGPGPATESYLSAERLLKAARISGADAVHPGYGFLSENADFAAACEAAGLIFIGPPPGVIRLLGDKIVAKDRMAAAGVPVVPGYRGEDQADARLHAEAERIGAPVLIKAAAGGGGRGMRVVEALDGFDSALDSARREARAAFGDDRVLLESYIAHARHVEFQILADAHGHVVHLFERECSIQRRHQKIIEESPSPALDATLRARMAQAAVAAGVTAGYVNAGTVEFLLEIRPEGDPAFYFLEVNTRLQVEHPVTEMLIGRDLVRLQLDIAQGAPLPFTQEEIRTAGHAIEVRIYAEDVAAGFLPSVGHLTQWIEPKGPGVRVDSGVERGGEVSPYYDPMLAKLIVHAETRVAALARLEQALLSFHTLGVRTNIAYLLAIVRHPAFRAGDLSTDFLRRHFEGWQPLPDLPADVLLALAAEAVTAERMQANVARAATDGDLYNPWHASGAWRNT